MNTQRTTGAVLVSLTALLLGACSTDDASDGGERSSASSEAPTDTSASDSPSLESPSAGGPTDADDSGYHVLGATSSELEAGRWAVTAAGSGDAPLAVLDLPAGVFGGSEFVWDNKGWIFGYWTVDGVYVDPCTRAGGTFDAEWTPDLFVEALAAQRRTTTLHPAPVRLGGYRGTYVELASPAGLDVSACRADQLAIFKTTGKSHHWVEGADVTMRYWAVDVDGELVILSGAVLPGATKAQARQLTDVVESVRFKRA